MHSHPLRVSVAATCLLVLVSACGDDNDPPADAVGADATASETTASETTASDTPDDSAEVSGAPVADFCPAYIAALCDAEAACCTGAGKWPSAAVCVQGEGNICTTMTLAFSDPRLAYDAGAAAAYLMDLRTRGGQCELGVDRLANARPTFLAGTVNAGGACTMSSPGDVIGRWSCKGGGVCHPTVNGGALGAGVCGAPSGQGGACIHSDECAEGFHCVGAGSQPVKLGTCAAGVGAGVACGANRDCTGGACDKSECLEATVNLLFCMNGPDSGTL